MKKLVNSGFNRSVHYCYAILSIASLFAIITLSGQQAWFVPLPTSENSTEMNRSNQFENTISYAESLVETMGSRHLNTETNAMIREDLCVGVDHSI